MTLEAILAGAGYNVVIDGSFSAAEQAALQNFEDRLNDKQFMEAGKELLGMILGTDEGGNPLLPAFGQLAAHTTPAPSPVQSAAVKMLLKLMPDP